MADMARYNGKLDGTGLLLSEAADVQVNGSSINLQDVQVAGALPESPNNHIDGPHITLENQAAGVSSEIQYGQDSGLSSGNRDGQADGGPATVQEQIDPQPSVSASAPAVVVRQSWNEKEIVFTFPMGHPIDTSKYTYWTRLLPAIQACYKDTVDFKKAAELLNEDYSKSAGGSVPEKTSSYSVKAPRNSWSGSAIEIRYMVLDNLLQPELVRIEVFCPTWRSNPDFSTQHMLSPALDAFPEDHTYFRRGPKNENGHYNVTIMTPIRKRKGEKVKKEIWASSKDFMLFFELPLSYDAANKKLKVPNLKNLVLDLEFFPHSEITDRVNWILGAFPDLKCLYLYAGEKWFGAMSAHNLLKSGLPLDMVLAAAKGEHFDRFEKVKNGLLAAKKTDIELKFVAFELPIPEIQKIMDGAAAA